MLKNKNEGFLNIPTTGQHDMETGGGKASGLERRMMQKLLQYMGNPPLCIELWDGTKIRSAGFNEAGNTLKLSNRKVLWRLLLNPGLNFGDDFSAGLIELDGDLVDFLQKVYLAQSPAHRSSLLERYAIYRPSRLKHNSLSKSKQNIHHHYDLGNDFYRLWLDEDMVYTCAYFPDADMSLEAAQKAKLDLVCKKLRLQPGETVVEAGCGWGSLALHMARHYGVKVRAFNISHEQIKYANERAARENLSDLIEYVEDDYRNITGDYDVFVSVGMMEHVGRSNYKAFGEVIDTVLKKNGRGLIHSISQNEPRPVSAWLEQRIFPGGYTPTLREMCEMLEPLDCVVVDVENLRMHYAKTVEHWLRRFEDHVEEITAMYDEAFVRAWRLYLSGCIANFVTNSLQLYQILFTRVWQPDVPWTRAYLYQD
jgi:cyclopropane-fatty-acyl-phospholipid synthase